MKTFIKRAIVLITILAMLSVMLPAAMAKTVTVYSQDFSQSTGSGKTLFPVDDSSYSGLGGAWAWASADSSYDSNKRYNAIDNGVWVMNSANTGNFFGLERSFAENVVKDDITIQTSMKMSSNSGNTDARAALYIYNNADRRNIVEFKKDGTIMTFATSTTQTYEKDAWYDITLVITGLSSTSSSFSLQIRKQGSDTDTLTATSSGTSQGYLSSLGFRVVSGSGSSKTASLYIDNLSITKEVEDDAVSEISDISMTVDNHSVTALETGDVVSSVDVTNGGDYSSATLIAALRNNGVLCDVDTNSKIIAEGDTATLTTTVAVPQLWERADKAEAYTLDLYLWDSLSGLMPLQKNIEIAPAAPFVWGTDEIKFTKEADGTYTTDFDAAAYKVEETEDTTYYVDAVNGSDDNDGKTTSTALKSIRAAFSKGAVTVYLMEGHYNYPLSAGHGDQYVANRDMNIIAYNGADVQVSTAAEGTWTKTNGYTNVYEMTPNIDSEQTNKKIYSVYDATTPDANGDYTEYTVKTTIDDVEATAGSWYYNSTDGKVYVHTANSADPSTLDIRAYHYVANIRTQAENTLYIEGIDFEGGRAGAVEANRGCVVAAKNCTFKYASGNGGFCSVGAVTYAQNCVSAHNEADGFNYHYHSSSGTLAYGVEIGCTGRDNGISDNTSNDNGTTAHDGCQVFRLNGNYYDNYGPNIADVNDNTRSWNIACTARDSAAAKESEVIDITAYGAARLWLTDCSTSGSESKYSMKIGTSSDNAAVAYITGGSIDSSKITDNGLVVIK